MLAFSSFGCTRDGSTATVSQKSPFYHRPVQHYNYLNSLPSNNLTNRQVVVSLTAAVAAWQFLQKLTVRTGIAYPMANWAIPENIHTQPRKASIF